MNKPGAGRPTKAESARSREIGKREHQYDAVSLAYNQRADQVDLKLVSGLRVIIPRKMISELAEMPRAVVEEMRLGVRGGAIEVRSQDIDISVRGLMRDLVGANFWRLGGQAKSPAKAAASRANGRSGGRPRKRELVAPTSKAAPRVRQKT